MAYEDELKALKTQVADLEAAARRPDYSRARQVNGVPFTTQGPVGEGRGFRLSKALAMVAGIAKPEDCKPELEALGQFRKALESSGYDDRTASGSSVVIPLGSELLPLATTSSKEYRHFKSMSDADSRQYDPDYIEHMARTGTGAIKKTAMSYLADLSGGTLVAPPVQGELIELIRPKEALLNAGATTVPLPPNGRIVYPRQTGPTTMYWVGENTEITESNPTTGQIALQAKKGGVLTTVPNELLLYASVTADAMIRNDAAKTLALGLDYAGLYGSGGAAQPKGLVSYTASNQVIDYMGLTPAPKGLGTNGNTLRPEDGYRMIGLLEDRNFDFSGWIFRPTMANNITGFRSDAVTASDAAGTFVQGLMRMIGDRTNNSPWCGFPISKSATVRNNQTKGSSGATLTEVFGGQWEHLLIGMYGAVEFAASNQAGNSFKQDQTQIRALIHCDVVPRYEGAFIWAKLLLNQTN